MKIKRALKVRLYPTPEQLNKIKQTAGCKRLVYNLCLAHKNEFYENNIKNKDLTNEEKIKIYSTYEPPKIVDIKKEYPFLKNISYKALEQGVQDLFKSFLNFFHGRTDKPKFKKKKNHHDKYRENQIPVDFFKWNDRLIKLPKIGYIKFANRKLPKWFNLKHINPKNLTVEIVPSGRVFVSINCEYEASTAEKVWNGDENQVIGLDFSPAKMFVDSNGNIAPDYKPHKQIHNKRLKRLKRQLSRRGILRDEHNKPVLNDKGHLIVIDSNNREKARIKVAKLEEHIANCRNNWQWKEVIRICRNYEAVSVESLTIKNMMQFSRNAKNYVDASWGMFGIKLGWKSKFYNTQIIENSKWFPSSQLCHCCGYRNKTIKDLRVRKWDCPNCDEHHDRDVNAAINLKLNAIKHLNSPIMGATVGSTGCYVCGGH